MNYLPILKLGFSNTNNADITITAKNIIKKMKGNVNFPTLQDKVAELEAAFDLFFNSILPPDAQSQVTRDILKMNRKKLITQLKSLGNLVMGVAAGDIEILLTSGYSLREKPTARPVPNTPEDIEIFTTNTPGVIMVSCKKVAGATNYIARLSLDKENWNWNNFETSTKVGLENVPTNQLIYVQMRTKNSAGLSHWSNVVETYLPAKDLPTVKKMNISNSLA